MVFIGDKSNSNIKIIITHSKTYYRIEIYYRQCFNNIHFTCIYRKKILLKAPWRRLLRSNCLLHIEKNVSMRKYSANNGRICCMILNLFYVYRRICGRFNLKVVLKKIFHLKLYWQYLPLQFLYKKTSKVEIQRKSLINVIFFIFRYKPQQDFLYRSFLKLPTSCLLQKNVCT